MIALRNAASLILYRQDAAGCRILMGRRHASHKFLPDHLVFPGGGVDAQDYTAELAEPLRPDVLAQVCLGADPALAQALGHTAARELEEETGLSLGTPPALGGLIYLCRAETPASQPIRFNARFFIADAACVTGAIGGSGELEALTWYSLDDALMHDLAFATRQVLGQFQAWLARDHRPLVLRDRTWQAEQA
jgi:8-oxo-dGTP pyrophosphatase MutT (NUDIX family)